MVQIPTVDFADLRNSQPGSLLKNGVFIINGINQDIVDDLYNQVGAFIDSELRTSYIGKLASSALNYLSDYDREGLYNERPVNDQGVAYNWPTNADFPGLQTAYSNVFDEWRGPLNIVAGPAKKFLLGVFKYFQSNEVDKKSEHRHADEHFIAFKPLGEPLDVRVDGEWHTPELARGQALMIPPHIYHRVRNTTQKERLSAIFGLIPKI